MDQIVAAQKVVDDAKKHLHDVVQEARQRGVTWAQIGGSLGMSRQAAFKRFAEVTNPATGERMRRTTMSITEAQQMAERVFDLIGSGEHSQLQELIHPEAREELPAELIADTWARLLGEVGAVESYEDTHVALPAGERLAEGDSVLGTVVGVTTLSCEAGRMMGRVALDDQQRIVGLLVVSPEQSSLPF